MSEPRRWVLEATPSLGIVGTIYPSVSEVDVGEAVPVREDRIMDEDVQAVASQLALIEGFGPNQWPVYEDRARRVLGVVLGVLPPRPVRLIPGQADSASSNDHGFGGVL